eukprot:2540950-Pleurochrysis_carterae.AAC.1
MIAEHCRHRRRKRSRATSSLSADFTSARLYVGVFTSAKVDGAGCGGAVGIRNDADSGEDSGGGGDDGDDDVGGGVGGQRIQR